MRQFWKDFWFPFVMVLHLEISVMSGVFLNEISLCFDLQTYVNTLKLKESNIILLVAVNG